jgi:hypothetical protein
MTRFRRRTAAVLLSTAAIAVGAVAAPTSAQANHDIPLSVQDCVQYAKNAFINSDWGVPNPPLPNWNAVADFYGVTAGAATQIVKNWCVVHTES